MPIRLGDDAFLRKSIPEEKIKKLANTMLAFKYLMEAYVPQIGLADGLVNILYQRYKS